MTYDFKFFQELAWAAVTAAVIAIGGELLTFDRAVLADPLTWGLALLGAAGRAAVAAVIARVRGSFSLS